MTKSYKREKGTKRSTNRQVSAEENLKVPTLMDSLGLTKEVLIEKYLIPLLSANTTICIREKGKTRRVSIVYYGTRQRALDMAFKLSGAYAPMNLKLAEGIGDVIDIIEMPSRREGIHVIDIPPPRKKDT
jgi:hypothetical protein